jgi:hypothetical protein
MTLSSNAKGAAGITSSKPVATGPGQYRGMKGALLAQCREYTRKFMSDPACSLLFLDPIDFGSDAANAEYRRIVQKPMNLSTVYSKLKDRDESYSSVDEWARDMSLIFDNSIRFNDEGSAVAGIAQYFKTKLEKYVQRINCERLSENEYTAKLCKITAKYLDILAHPPEPYDQGPAEVKFENMKGNLRIAALDILADELNRLLESGAVVEVSEILEKGDFREADDGVTEIDVGDLADQDIDKLWAIVRRKKEFG